MAKKITEPKNAYIEVKKFIINLIISSQSGIFSIKYFNLIKVGDIP